MIKNYLFVIIPGVILILGFLLLLVENLFDVTERPEENWSRAIHIGVKQGSNYPVISEANNRLSLIELFDGVLTRKTFDKTYEQLSSQTYERIPFSKWTEVYLNGDNLYYYDFYLIFNGNTGEVIGKADEFYPLKESIVFKKGDDLYQIDASSGKVRQLGKLEKSYEKIIPYQTGNTFVFLAYKQTGNLVHVDKYNVNIGGIKPIFQTELSLYTNENLKEVSFTTTKTIDDVILASEIEGAGGKPPRQRITLLSFTDNKVNQVISDIQFLDPNGDTKLDDVTDISTRHIDGQLHVLFSALGNSKTKFRSDDAFNIYEASVKLDQIIVERRSNTSDLSIKPQWINDKTVAWIDRKGEENPIYVATSDQTIIKENSITYSDIMQALGKTFGMTSIALFTIIISIIWLIWPIFILIIVYLINKRLIDTDPSWIYYVSITLYGLSYLLFKDKFFTDMLVSQAPEYLTFNGSFIYFSVIFGIIAYIATSLAEKTKEWRAFVKFLYFSGIHILLLMVTYGPYLL